MEMSLLQTLFRILFYVFYKDPDQMCCCSGDEDDSAFSLLRIFSSEI